MIKFIHTADIHFGMENYGRIDPETGIHTRLLDFERALNYCIDIGIEEKIDFFLFAGDAYKTANPSPTQQKLLMRCFLRLYRAGIPIVIVVGNHDNPLSFGKANSLEIFNEVPLDGFHVFSQPDLITLETKNGPIQIVGIPWPTRNTISLNKKHLLHSAEDITRYISEAVGTLITNFAQKCDPTIPSILTSHMTVSSGVFSGSEKRAVYGTDPTLMPSQLALKPFDYVALGHLHRYQNLNKNGYPAIVYSGSIERIDFGERKEPKGFCLVSVTLKKTSHIFIEVPARPFIQVDVKLDTQREDQTEQVINALKKHTLDNAVVKIVYHIPDNQTDMVNIGTIERACSHAHYLVGIIPIHNITTREKRRGLKVEMDLATLLDSYFEEKPAYKSKKKLLTQKALELYNQSQNIVEEEEG
ncbi:MAG: exonuclease SbcD [Alteromonas naphthalenivorans]|jgi:exonuclease SbcD